MRGKRIRGRRHFACESLEQRQLLADTTVFVSTLTTALAANGWGPIELDHSNGEAAAGDGKTITLNGKTYGHGLGVHANSEVDYNILASNGYTNFLADVGVDDEVGSNGSVTFQVFLDGTIKYNSGTLTGSSASASVNVNIAGFTGKVRLIVTDAGNGNTFDHADWADARVLVASSTPVISLYPLSGGPIAENGGSYGVQFLRQGSTSGAVTVNFGVGGTATRGADYVLRLGSTSGSIITGNSVTFPNGATSANVYIVATNDSIVDPDESIILSVASGTGYNLGGPNTQSTNIIDDDAAVGFAYLSDLPFNIAQNGWGPVELNTSNGESPSGDGKKITINGATYAKGIGVHANSDITYNLNGAYAFLDGVVGVDDEVGNSGSVQFHVFADNVEIYTSPVITGAQGGVPIQGLYIRNAAQLRLVVTDSGDGNAYDHADWADVKVRTSGWNIGVAARGSIFPPVAEGTSSERFIVDANPFGANPGPLSFDYETYDITATAGLDYVPITGHIDLPANSVGINQSFYLTILNDSLHEGTEKVGFRIKNVVGNAIVGTTSDFMRIQGDLSTALSTLTPASQTNGWGPIERDKSNGESAAGDGKTLTLNGTTYDTGLGVHANSDITYNISGQHGFAGFVGIDDEVSNNGSVVFQIFVDGVKKFDSGIVTGSSAPHAFSVNLVGASTLRLVVTDGGNGTTYDHADWANAFIG